MGLIKAAAGAIGGQLADSWLDYIQAAEMGPTTIMCRGVQVHNKRSSNKKGNDNVISNGSKIVVGPNQMMFLVEDGKIIDYTAEAGYYEVFMSSAPSMFNGQFGDSLKDTFQRFKFGGQPTSAQQVYFVNLSEIRGIKFGTRNAVQYFDNFYNAELFLRCHGTYSVKISDPMKFYMECTVRNNERVNFEDISEQFNAEFLNALSSAVNQMSVDGVRISTLPSQGMKLAKYMSDVLDEDWKNIRGIEIASVGISSISYDEESKKLINMRNQGAMLSDPTIREGYVQGSVARGMEAAGSNTAGAGQAFMAMGMGMQNAGGFMGAASSNNMAQMQMQQQAAAQQQAAKQVAGEWKCSCGQANTGNFCTNCGGKKPAASGEWTCSCGTVNTGNFCTNCGNKKPAASGEWTCSCGTVNTGNFCTNCGNKRG